MILSVEINPNSIELIERLKRNTGASSYGALFNDALTLLGWAVKQRQQGRIVASLEEGSNSYKELQMTPLERAAGIVELDAAADLNEEVQRRPEVTEIRPLARASGR